MRKKILTGIFLGCLAFVPPAFSQDNKPPAGPDPVLQQKAEQGNTEAQFRLGVYYFRNKDSDNGVKWMRKSADQGYADAQNALGVRFYYGTGVTQDKAEGEKYLRKAAEQGHKQAEGNLCNCYDDKLNFQEGADKTPPVIVPFKASKEDMDEAKKWCGRAARKGFSDAAGNYGLLNARGTAEVKPDLEEAYFWFSVEKRPTPVLPEVEKQLTPERVAEIKEKAKNWTPEKTPPAPPKP
jgi:hypothetical protein